MGVKTVGSLHGAVGLVVDCSLKTIQRLEENIALIKSERDFGRSLIGPDLNRVARGARRGVEPAAVVNLIGDELRKLHEEQIAAAIHDTLIDVLKTPGENLHAGSLVNAAALSSDNAVLESVLHTDTVAAADLVDLEHNLVRSHLLAVNGDAAALLELKNDLLDLVGSLLGPHAHRRLNNAHRSLHRLEILSLVGETGEVGVGRILLLRSDERFDTALFKERDHLGTAGELLEKIVVAPRGVDAEIRIENIRITLKAHLVVAATRSAVDENLATGLLHRGEKLLDGDGAGDTRGVPVAAVVHGLALDRLKANIGHFLRNVDDRRIDASGSHTLGDVVDILLIGLADVGGERLNLHARVEKNAANRLRIETARNAYANGLTFEIFKFHIIDSFQN